MELLLIDIMGSTLGIFCVLLLFETFWVRKRVGLHFFVGGITLNTAAGVLLTALFQNVFILPVLVVLLNFSLSFYYDSAIGYKVFITILASAITLIAEVLVSVVLVRILLIPIEQIQEYVPAYIFGVLTSNLLTLFTIFIMRIFIKGSRLAFNTPFNLLMATMPIQSIILCFIVFNYSLIFGELDVSWLAISSILLSIVLIVVTFIILTQQRKALIYKNGYKLSRLQNKMQVEHSQELYNEQARVRKMRHDINNNIIAILGMLQAGKNEEAIGRMEQMSDDTSKPSEII